MTTRIAYGDSSNDSQVVLGFDRNIHQIPPTQLKRLTFSMFSLREETKSVFGGYQRAKEISFLLQIGAMDFCHMGLLLKGKK